jgi:4-hydroxy-tetrahydrodipicolinate synthase
MAQGKKHAGVLSPVLTPFNEDLSPNADLLIRQCRWLVACNVGLAFFGTNSEANSLSLDERLSLLEALVEAGLPTDRMMPGTGCCALPDTVALTKRAVELGCGGVLMLPPFYYKGLSDEGLFRAYARVIEQVADDRLRIYLYHIPPVAQVPITLSLIDMLLKEFPGIIAGIKDSSGDWDNTKAMLERFQPHGFDVFAGSETFLLDTLRGGGAGCISATANVNPRAIAHLAETWQQDDANQQQAGLNRVRMIFQRLPMIAAMKAAVAHYSGISTWSTLRPPLVELSDQARNELLAALDEIDFTMPGLGE